MRGDNQKIYKLLFRDMRMSNLIKVTDRALVEGLRRLKCVDILPPTEDLEELNPIGRNCFFSAPKYALTRRENHGMGYHAPLQVLKSGDYVRAGYILSKRGKFLLASPHGGQTLLNIRKKRNAVVREIRNYVGRVFRGVPDSEMLMLPEDSVVLMPIN